MFDTKMYEKKMDDALEHFEGELKKVRTGRAHTGMLDGVMAEAYGSKMPLNQVANVTAPEPQMLVVTPFDPTQLPAIAAAIRDAPGLGFNPSDDGRVIRVPVPALTEERRREMVKSASEKVEDCRIALRSVRQDALKDAKKMKDAKELSEDDERAVSKEFDRLMQAYQAKIDQAFAEKEKDILTI